MEMRGPLANLKIIGGVLLSADASTHPDNTGKHYTRDTLEFQRVISLSDAVFAIAMTLLVLTLDVPDVPAFLVPWALLEQSSQFVAFLLSFVLVSIIWYHHHNFVSMLEKIEPGLIYINFVLLGGVVLIPYPTNLVGNNPQSSFPVVMFIAMHALLSFLYLAMVYRAQVVQAWRTPMTERRFYWELASSGGGVAVLLLALVVAFWHPLVGLSILGLSMIVGPLVSRFTFME